MTGWKTSSNRKVHQRAINKAIRQVNKNITNDDLWLGRFYIKQGSYHQWWQYEDGSGGNLYVVLEFHDRLTGRVKEIGEETNHFTYWNGSHLFRDMNDFIVNEYDCNAWGGDIRPGSAEYKAMIADLRDKNGNIIWPY